MKKNRTLRWLYSVPGSKKLYIVALALIQGLNGITGVVFALLMRNVVVLP